MVKNPSAWEKAVTAPEPLPVGNAIGPSSPSTSDTSTNSSRPSSEAMRTGTRAVTVRAASGGSPARARITGATKAWKVKIAEVGNPGSTMSGLSPIDREAKRLARFERHAVHEDARRAEPRHDAMRQIARALRRAAGEHDHVAGIERGAHGKFERDLFVGKRAERHRLAACFDDRGGNDRAVAVIDAGRLERPAGLDQFVAGREHGDARTAHHLDSGKAARREHADLARADARALAQQRFAARNVRTGIRNELPAGTRRGAPRSPARRRPR